MEPARLALLGLAALLAAVINSVAGGGSLVSFPALLAMGVPPVLASATNTAALTPGNLAAAIAFWNAPKCALAEWAASAS